MAAMRELRGNAVPLLQPPTKKNQQMAYDQNQHNPNYAGDQYN